MSAKPETANSKGVSYQDLIASDAVPPPRTLTLANRFESPLVSVPVSRYTTKAFHDLEMEKLWPKVWQMACREEEIPNVGDYSVYEIGSYSIIVVRTKDGIKAHHNVCRHRGRKLCEGDGHAASFICPFHGFSWHTDGSLRGVTSDWDFPHIDQNNFDLTPVQCDSWAGWVFVNMDMEAGPLQEFLGDLPAHFECWEPQDRYIEAHVAKVMPCNWKLAQEAFMEAFHVITTHPQILAGIGDENTQYDAWGNLSRAITPNGTPSPHLRYAPDEQELLDAVMMKDLDAPSAIEVPPGATARSVLAAVARQNLAGVVGDNASLSDACLNDSIYYTLFPNFHPWGGYSRIVYRFRPYKNHHDKSVMECYFLSPFAGERPAPAPVHWLGEEDDWTAAPELGRLAKVFQQDTFNLPKVQQGLEAAQYDEVVLANYQETKLRHFHHTLKAYL
jgi:phenylpropionate dioxygenase-like ring-hydroxylating dioxygenase large terminal subunit